MPRGLRPILTVGQSVLRTLPPRTASDLSAWLMARGGAKFLNRKTMLRNLHNAFPDRDHAEIEVLCRSIATNFGRLISEVVHIDRFGTGARGARLEVGPRVWQGPAVYVGAHVGGWELIPMAFGKDIDKLIGIYSRNKNPFIEEMLSRMRQRTGGRYVDKAVGLKPSIETLKHGGSVVLLADQRVDSGLEVEFFGRPTIVTRFPARLAMKFGVPIIPFEIVRIAPAHLRADFLAPIMPDANDGENADYAMTQAMASALEGMIKRDAGSWFCNKHRWKEKKSK